MTDRYVSVQALIENIIKIPDLRRLSTKTIGEAISKTPTADVVEVKHGEWVPNPYYKSHYYCSECGRHIEDGSDNPNEHFPYCHCGAKMDGVKKCT